MGNDQKCENRVQHNLDSRLEDLRLLWDAYCQGEEDVEDLGNIFEYGLAFDYVALGTFSDQERAYFRYQLSWGGPSDEFRFYTAPFAPFVAHKIEYWLLDWFDGAHRILRSDNHNFMLGLYNWFRDMGSVQAEFDKAME